MNSLDAIGGENQLRTESCFAWMIPLVIRRKQQSEMKTTVASELTPAFVSVSGCCPWFMSVIRVTAKSVWPRPDLTEGLVLRLQLGIISMFFG